jgi:excinuclease ABC subunit C
LPDLILVDGGRGQLAVAIQALQDIGIEGVELAALAKDRVLHDPAGVEVEHSGERVFRPGRANPISLHRNSGALFLLQQLRDEAHRFAITYHRKLRAKRRLRSRLDEVAGVGAAKRRALLRRFGSVRRIGEASVEELVETAGIDRELAERIRAHLSGS